MTKYGMIYFAVFSSYDTDPQDKFYGAFCIVSDRNSKSSRMVNILDLSRAIKPTEAIKICSSIKSVSTQTNTLNL